MDENTKEIVDTLNLILTKMVTKDDLASQVDGLRTEMQQVLDSLHTEIDGLHTEMRQGFASIHAEIRDIHSRLDAIESELKNHSGFAKEIDHLMKRVVDIEKHLGIQRKITA